MSLTWEFLQVLILNGSYVLLAYNANWNYIAVLWIVNFGLYRNDFKKQIIGYSLIGLLFYIIQGLIRVGPHVGYRIGIFVPLLFIYIMASKEKRPNGQNGHFISSIHYI